MLLRSQLCQLLPASHVCHGGSCIAHFYWPLHVVLLAGVYFYCILGVGVGPPGLAGA